MLRLTLETNKTQPEVIAEALGLEADEGEGSVTFSGGGGYVTLALESNRGRTAVDITTSEFEEPVRQFARAIG